MSHQELPSIIAIDGPAASGKSTLGKKVADSLGYMFFDTGVMYRAVTWLVLERGILVDHVDEVSDLAEKCEIDVRPPSVSDDRSNDIFVDGQDITWEIRSKQVEGQVSTVSTYPRVRQALSLQQRRIGLRGRVVMVGRDIGSAVLPEADIKIFLDASAEERARRRCQEKLQRGEDANYAEILKGILWRDEIDSSRSVSPLVQAEDAIRINSDHMDIAEVFDVVMNLVKGNAHYRAPV